MLTLNETFAVPDVDHAWSVINDLDTLVPWVPGARVKSIEGPQAVKAEIAVRMGAMGMTFTGPVTIDSTDVGSRTITIKANCRETLGQSYATGDITICLRGAEGNGTIRAIANVGGKAAGMGEGVIVDVLTNLVRAFSANLGTALAELPPRAQSEPPPAAGETAVDRAEADVAAPAADAGAVAIPVAPANGQDPAKIFRSLTSRFGGRLDVKLTSGVDEAPLLKASGQGFAMLHGAELVVRLHPERCADLVDLGKGRLFAHDGQTHDEWLVIAGLDAAEWTAHTMEALACAQD